MAIIFYWQLIDPVSAISSLVNMKNKSVTTYFIILYINRIELHTAYRIYGAGSQVCTWGAPRPWTESGTRDANIKLNWTPRLLLTLWFKARRAHISVCV
jgi:hypothetical protein